jgi:hypothetical protein
VQRMEVYGQDGKRAGAIDVDHWRRRVRRGRYV